MPITHPAFYRSEYKPIYRKTAAYGHFGGDDIEFPWERTDKTATLKKAAGL